MMGNFNQNLAKEEEKMEQRKIYTKVVIDMKTGETTEEEYFYYSGAMALCDGEDDPGDDFEGFGEEGGEEDLEDEPEVGEEEEEESSPDVNQLHQTIQELQTRLEELTELNTPKPGEEPHPEQGPPQYEDQQFVASDDDLDKVLNSAEGLNKTLNSAVQTAIQHVYQGIPGVIKNNVAQQVQLQETVSNFYSENPELKKHRAFVGKVSERIMKDNPNWSMQQVLEETSKEARKRLKLKQKAEGKAKGKNPGFAKGGKGGKGSAKAKLAGQEKEIADMLSVVDT